MDKNDFTLKHPFSNNIVEIVNLKYSKFVEMVKELNSIAEYFLDDDGFRLSFAIVKESASTFLWKLTVKIECSKYKVGDQNSKKSYRIFRLNQFMNIHTNIKQQFEALKVFEPTSENENPGTSYSGVAAACSLKESKLFDTIQSVNDSCKDEDTCCICMDSRANLILSCTHNYCEHCIKAWKVTSQTCPICRCKSGENDGFILADKPDYYNIQDDLSKSLFQITDQSLFKTSKLQASNQNSSDESVEE